MKRPLSPAWAAALLLSCLASAPALRADPGVPPVLDAVLRKMARDQGHWACTWSSVWTSVRGHPGGEFRSVVDPSRPYGEQWRWVLVDGHPPDAKALRQSRENGEKDAKKAEDRAAVADDGGPPYAVHMTLDYTSTGNQHAVALYDQARLVQEDGDHAVFDVPLQSDRASLILPQFWKHYHMLLRVDRRVNNIEHLSIVMRRPIALVKMRFRIDTDYATIDPRYSAVEVKMDAEVEARLLVKGYYFRQQLACSDFRRVRPYGDQFKVRIGPLRSLGTQAPP